ncbi:Alcohol oxidase [Mycena chlorophos]|uniref:Alcohol oxidase n=1 Tax=Mycena chlorophos TaxID=658473 RepID=A0A8H6SW95_MYCCL|nr:Alcohol oxidase [Mycena chlorophos]
MRSLSRMLLLAPLSLGAVLESYPELEKLGLQFDFIVVGGGNAGNVVANRLSENAEYSVLVLEAGGSHEGNMFLQTPLLAGLTTPFTATDWNYTTLPQTGFGGRQIPYPRGYVLGGSSSVNYLAYTRGSKEDYDRIAVLVDDERWSWDGLLPYMLKNERFTEPADGHDMTGQFDPTVHGFEGITSVSLNGHRMEIDELVLRAMEEDDEFALNVDMNSGYPLGIGFTQLTSLNGERSSSATSYLAPEFVARPNLQVLLHACVMRVLQNEKNDFRTVEFRDSEGSIFSLTAKKEVILSAGSVNTPNLLMHSGIGNATTLAGLGIEPHVDLPSVGQNLTDHPLLTLTWEVNATKVTNDAVFHDHPPGSQAAAIEEWTTKRTGLVTNDLMSHLAWLRVPENASIFENHPDPSAGPNTPHVEIMLGSGYLGSPPFLGNFQNAVLAVVSPAARGSISIGSSDPFAPPLIDPNVLSTEVDMFFMRSIVRSAMRFFKRAAFAEYIVGPPIGLPASVVDWEANQDVVWEEALMMQAPLAVGRNDTVLGKSQDDVDAELDVYIRAHTGTVFHPVGTASMSPIGAEWGVVDPDLRVKGVNGLRIVDLSVLPLIPSAHTQAAAYAIGERGAEMIKESW